MDEKQLKALWESMSATHELGNFDAFKKNIYSDSNFRKGFWEEAAPQYEIGDYKTFEESFKKKVTPLQPSPSSAIPSLSQTIEKGYDLQSQYQPQGVNVQRNLFPDYENVLGKRASLYKAESNAAQNLQMGGLGSMPSMVSSTYENLENQLKTIPGEREKYDAEAKKLGDILIPSIKTGIKNLEGLFTTKNGELDYSAIGKASSMISQQLGGGDYVKEQVRQQIINQEEYSKVKPAVNLFANQVWKKMTGKTVDEFVGEKNQAVKDFILQKQVLEQNFQKTQVTLNKEYTAKSEQINEKYKAILSQAKTEEEQSQIASSYITEMNGLASQYNSRINRVKKEVEDELKSKISKAELSDETKKQLDIVYNEAYKYVTKANLDKKQREQDELYGKNWYNQLLPYNPYTDWEKAKKTFFAPKFIALGWKSATGAMFNGVSNLGNGLVGLGLGGGFTDFLRGQQQRADRLETIDVELKGTNWLKPNTFATRLGKQIGFQAPIIAATAFTKNPYMAGTIGFGIEQVQNAGEVYNTMMQQYDDPIKAQNAAKNYLTKNLPTLPLYFLESEMMLRFARAKPGVLKNLAAENLNEITQELIQGYTQQQEYKNAKSLGTFLKEDAPNIALETALTTTLQSGLFAAGGKIMKKLGTDVEYAQKSHLYNLVSTKGLNAAFGVLELKANNKLISPEEMAAQKEKLAKLNNDIFTLKDNGLTDVQVGVYLGLTAKLDAIREKQAKSTNPQITQSYQKEIESIEKKIQDAVMGKLDGVSVTLPSGSTMTLEGNGEDILSELNDEIATGQADITSTDDKVNQKVEELKQKSPPPVPDEALEQVQNEVGEIEDNFQQSGYSIDFVNDSVVISDLDGNIIGIEDIPADLQQQAVRYEDLAIPKVEAEVKPTEVKVKEPTIEEKLKDIQDGNTVTFTYEKESDVPTELQGKISSKGENNGKPFVRVTISKVEADYLLSKEQKPKAEVKAEPTKTLTNKEKVEQLRAEEQAEYDAIKRDDGMVTPLILEKQREIYDRYDKLITPLLEAEKKEQTPSALSGEQVRNKLQEIEKQPVKINITQDANGKMEQTSQEVIDNIKEELDKTGLPYSDVISNDKGSTYFVVTKDGQQHEILKVLQSGGKLVPTNLTKAKWINHLIKTEKDGVVKAVESLLSKEQTPKAEVKAEPTKPLTNKEKIEQLRAEEQAEYDATLDFEVVKRQEIYDRYDKLITPLLESETTAKENNPALKDETPIISTPKKLSTSGLPDLDIVESKEANEALESEIGGDKGIIDKNIRTIPIQEYDVPANRRSKQIAEQIEENGWIEPLIVSYDKNGQVYIVEGQHRAAALKELGYDKAPVIVIHEKDLGKQSLPKKETKPTPLLEAEKKEQTPETQNDFQYVIDKANKTGGGVKGSGTKKINLSDRETAILNKTIEKLEAKAVANNGASFDPNETINIQYEKINGKEQKINTYTVDGYSIKYKYNSGKSMTEITTPQGDLLIVSKQYGKTEIAYLGKSKSLLSKEQTKELEAEKKEQTPALRDVESTAKELENISKKNGINTPDDFGNASGTPLTEIISTADLMDWKEMPKSDRDMMVNALPNHFKKLGDILSISAAPKDLVNLLSEIKNDFNEGKYDDVKKKTSQLKKEMDAWGKKLNPNINVHDGAGVKNVAEAYHKAKADGTNPELVKAVESLLSKEQTKEPKQEIKIAEDESENKYANDKLTEKDNIEQEPSIKAIESKAESNGNKAESNNKAELNEVVKQSNEIIKQVDEKLNAATDVRVVPLSSITTDESRFQNREELDQQVVNDIAENWKDADQDPIHVWTDPKNGKTYVLSGHHRFYGAKKAGRENVKIVDRTNDFTETQAIKFAKEEANANRTMETPLERAKALREKTKRGDSKQEINKFLEREGKNKSFVQNLAALNPLGKVMQMLGQFGNAEDRQTQKETEQRADWIGEARRTIAGLTDAHENEMFDFLFDKDASKRITTKADFLQKVRSVVKPLEPDVPLNIARFKNQTQGEAAYDEAVFEKKAEMAKRQEKINEINDRFSNPQNPNYISTENKEYKSARSIADNKISQLESERALLQKQLEDIYREKGKYTGAATSGSLFSATAPESTISKPSFDALIERISKAFPKVKFFYDEGTFKEKMKKYGNGNLMRTPSGTIYGATFPDGSVYINQKVLSAETPIHEASHIWEALFPKEWKNGVELFRQSKGFKKALQEVQSNKAYKNKTLQEQESEALNTLIGRKGEGYFQNELLSKFKAWLQKFFNYIGQKFGVKLSPDTKLNQFVNEVIGDILGGKPLTQEVVPAKGMMKINGENVNVKQVDVDVVNGFYSPLEKIISESKFDKLPAKQWAEKFAKGEEAKWTGLADWLSQQQGSVSKADIQKFLKDNRINIVEVVKGGDIKGRLKKIADKHNLRLDFGQEGELDIVNNEDGELYRRGDVKTLRDVAQLVQLNLMSEEKALAIKEIFDLNEPYAYESVPNEVKFGNYQLEGEKENYKEILVTLPSREDKTKTFNSSHFEEPNILVHLRMNTRKDSQGNKVLFLEEIQSDWNKSGRLKGFAPTKQDFKNADAEYGKFLNKVKKKYGDDWEYGLTPEEQSEEDRLLAAYKNDKIPSAPFVTDTSSYVKLALKVALKEAVKQGVDKIAWTTGEQQNERYDLSKQVDKIEIVKRDGVDSYRAKTYKDGKILNDQDYISFKELEGMFGKEIAKGVSEGKTSFEGEGLKVGGKGMKGFYGSPTEGNLGIVGNVAKSLFKQEPKTTTLQGEKPITIDNTTVERGTKSYVLKNENGDSLATMSFETGDNYSKKDLHGELVYLAKIYAKKEVQETTQQSIDITPELRAQVEKGQPMFMAKGSKIFEDYDKYNALKNSEKVKNPQIVEQLKAKYGQELNKVKDITLNFDKYTTQLLNSGYIKDKIC
jgi:ParB-like chromosome segregation protein Spo0J/uncharacterized coiled-coil protein SlyX